MNSRFPFPAYPRGWYQITTSKNLKSKKLYTFDYFGKSLVGYRAADHSVRVFDAHCPHLGAHLGVGGKIQNNHLVCPFHGWKFDSNGNCVEIPYCKTIPKRAQLQTYPVREMNGVVFIYYSQDYRQPEFELPVFKEFGDPSWSQTQTIGYQLQSHVQEMAENALDVGHFPLIHQMDALPTIRNFQIDQESISIQLNGKRRIFGITNTMDFELKAVGLGVVFGKTETDLMSVRAIHAATPINESTIQVSVTYVFNKTWNPIRNTIFQLFMNREIVAFTKGDHPVLAHKKYMEKPLLCTGDGPISKLRHWAKQFYEDLPHESPSVIPLPIHTFS